jgi:hypothetical protein
MAKKRSVRPAGKKVAASKKRGIQKPAKVAQAVERRWLELTGKKLQPTARVPATLISSITTLHAGLAAGAPVADPDIFIFVRKVQGTGCEKVAEIAGWYEMNLALWPNLPCIGRAAIKAILDAAATQFCCNTLKCPEKCPCHYIPQAALGLYTCDPGVVESGYLLQTTEVWNCECLEPPQK